MHYLIDNYDSFTYNLYQLIGSLTDEPITVLKNDAITSAELTTRSPESLILSPGPGRPEAAGQMPAIVRDFIGKVPILGVCLGHQAIGQAYGAKVVHADHLMHGKPSTIKVTSLTGLFKDCPQTFEGARYHSLVIDPTTIPSNLSVIAKTETDEIMAVADDVNHVYGVQFHPESIMTDPQVGRQLILNFLEIVHQQKLARTL
jgi:anthranilate synthase/aminodeoxychorismate synthase-like glutamine amidotransferase